MARPRLLDLFCGAGGAAMGYHRAEDAGIKAWKLDVPIQKVRAAASPTPEPPEPESE